MNGLFRLVSGGLQQVDFGVDIPRTFYRLSAVDDELWSCGERDLMSFDGAGWSRIV